MATPAPHPVPAALPEPPPQPQASAGSEVLPLSLKVYFAMPTFAGAAFAIPIAVNLPIFYSDTVGLSLGWIAIGIALARALDAVTDPMMGWISDRTRSRWGRRRPWIAVGVPPAALALIALFGPPAGMSEAQAALWFGAAFVAYFLFHTVYDMPHYGLGAELTLDYNERSSLFGIRAMFLVAGTVVGASAPQVLSAVGGSTRVGFLVTAIGFAALLIATYAVMLARVKERPEFVSRLSNPLAPGVRRSLRNRPFRILLIAYGVGSIAGAIPGTMIPYFSRYVLNTPAESAGLWLAIFLIAYFVSGFVALPIWIRIAKRWGKTRTWLATYVIGILGGSSLFLAGPGDQLFVLGILVVTGIQFGAGFFIGPAMQADVIDYDELHTGKRREGQYGSFWSIVTKLIVIPSAAVPLAVIGAMGYQPNVEQSPEVVTTIRVIYCLTPAFFSALSFLIARLYPISREVHAQILEGVRKHARGEDAVDPLTGEVLAPPSRRRVDEAESWRLDYFSSRELRGVLARGPAGLFPTVVAKVAVWTLLTAAGAYASTLWIVRHGAVMTDLEKMVVTLVVVATGCGLSVALFHATRLRPALGMRRTPPAESALRGHLGVDD